MKRNKLSASIMCADLMNIEAQVRELEAASIDFLHLDLVDNQFSPNITFGPDFINQLRKITNVPFEIHYMVKSPRNLLEAIDNSSIRNTHIFHLNITDSISEISTLVRQRGDRFGLAISPDEEIDLIEDHLVNLDVVLLLSVYPGFYGSNFVESSYERARKLVEITAGRGIEICADGAMSLQRSIEMSRIGAEIFVGGTSSIFNRNGTIKENVAKFFREIET